MFPPVILNYRLYQALTCSKEITSKTTFSTTCIPGLPYSGHIMSLWLIAYSNCNSLNMVPAWAILCDFLFRSTEPSSDFAFPWTYMTKKKLGKSLKCKLKSGWQRLLTFFSTPSKTKKNYEHHAFALGRYSYFFGPPWPRTKIHVWLYNIVLKLNLSPFFFLQVELSFITFRYKQNLYRNSVL